MSYLNAPSTRLLATHCCVCRRALRDALSVELGIGPICRKKHGYNIEVSPESRATANEIVHAVAIAQAITSEQVTQLHELGFAQLATILLDRIGDQVQRIHISLVTRRWRDRWSVRFAIRAPYSATAVTGWKRLRWTYWNREEKQREVAATESNIPLIVEVLQESYPSGTLFVIDDQNHPHRDLLHRLGARLQAVTTSAFSEQPCPDCQNGFRGNRECKTCKGEAFIRT